MRFRECCCWRKLVAGGLMLVTAIVAGINSPGAQAQFATEGRGYLTVGSSESIEGAQRIATLYAARFGTLSIFETSNGYFSVVMKAGSIDDLKQMRLRLISSGDVPADTYVTSGARYVRKVWEGVAGADDGSNQLQPDQLVGTVAGLNPNGDNFLSLRANPDSAARELARLGAGERLALISDHGKWVFVQRENGQQGYAFGRYIRRQVDGLGPTPQATTLRPPDITVAAVDRFIRRLVNEVTVVGEDLGDFYAPKVVWYDRGALSFDAVLKEKKAMQRRWPNRRNTIERIDVESRPSGNFKVAYDVRYELSNSEKSLCGHWSAEVEIEVDPIGRLRVVREDGRDLNRSCQSSGEGGLAAVQTPAPELQTAQTIGMDGRKVALVIGNGKYLNAPALPNPPNDASAMSTLLQRMGFEVISGSDLTRTEMEGLIAEFARQSSDARLSLFFYAGHGIQVDGSNYLVPVNAVVKDQTSLAFELVNVDTVTQFMGGQDKTSIVLLDACRDNPLSRSLARSIGTTRSASVGKGLAALNIERGGMLIGFATAPGDVAADGDGEINSPFTQALLKHLPTPGLEIELAMKRVKAEVLLLTRNRQRPWHNSDLAKEVYMVPHE